MGDADALTAALDNPVWHALTTAQKTFADRSDDGHVVEYQREVTPFCGVDHFDALTWQHLKDHFGHRAVVTIRAGERTAPDGWEELFAEPLTQYIAETPDPAPDLDFITLGAADVDEMIALTKATDPGPFLKRTHELGHYIGVRRDGELIAMAGERMRADAFSEISAVCVAESARRQGLAAALTTALVHEIRGRGQEAILHVVEGNDAGHALYQRIGFRMRGILRVGVWRWVGSD